MDYMLNLKDREPCDVYLKSEGTNLYAVVVQSRDAYAVLLDAEYTGSGIEVVCKKHAFKQKEVLVTVVDDLGLVDGTACYNQELSKVGEEAIYAVSSC